MKRLKHKEVKYLGQVTHLGSGKLRMSALGSDSWIHLLTALSKELSCLAGTLFIEPNENINNKGDVCIFSTELNAYYKKLWNKLMMHLILHAMLIIVS